MPETSDWLAPLRDAYERPWLVAERWRRDGGRVVGVLGHLVPRELIVAAGMLPIRLSARRLPAPTETASELPAGLADELSPETAQLLAALLDGRLRWLDGLVIGRDTEAYTQLFYVLRELFEEAEDRIPPLAFCDLLRQPLRTSARYNRLRARQLGAQLADWAGRELTDTALADAVAEERALAAGLQQLDQLRRAGLISGHQALVAAGATRSLPGAESRAALAALPELEHASRSSERPRLWLTGSGQDDPWAYECLESEGVLIVGEDHGWGDDGRESPALTRDPLDGIVDRYQFSARGSARAGLDRVDAVLAAVSESGAEAVLQLCDEHDQASGWELPRLRAGLGSLPLGQVTVAYRDRDPSPLIDALAELLDGSRGDV